MWLLAYLTSSRESVPSCSCIPKQPGKGGGGDVLDKDAVMLQASLNLGLKVNANF